MAKLHGSITLSSPGGTYGISGSVRRGGKLKFGAVAVGATVFAVSDTVLARDRFVRPWDRAQLVVFAIESGLQADLS